jgi:general nucleoside transport system ATP-binding protein
VTGKHRPSQAPSLETTAMSKSFGALKALQDVSIKVPAGSFHALLGENGAGKSTLVKCIMGFYGADRGSSCLTAPRSPSAIRATLRRSASAWCTSTSRWFPP